MNDARRPPLSSKQAQLEAVIKTAQYLAGLSSEREIWDELAKVAVHFLGSDLVAFVARRTDGEVLVHHCASAAPVCDRLIGAVRTTVRQVSDSGFLATEQVDVDGPYGLVFLPLDQRAPATNIMIVGHRSSEPLPRDLLNLYLAVAGLFKSTLTRLASQHLFVAMADNVPEMLFQLMRYPDGKLQFTYVSGGSRTALGLSPESLMTDASRFYRGLIPAEQEAFRAATALAAERLNRIFHWRDAQGGERHILVNAVAIPQEDGSTVWDGAVQDVTEHEQLEEERKQYLLRLESSMEATVAVMASTLEMRDPYTAGHQRRVADIATHIARELGLSEDEVHGIGLAASIHDIGKIHVPADILSFPGELGKLEFELVKTHPKIGYEILKVVDFPWPVAQMVLQHHERLDGSGYPNGLKGEEIILGARIIAIADVVESIASFRPYRPALGWDMALSEIAKERGMLYDEKAVDACLRLFRDKDYQVASV